MSAWIPSGTSTGSGLHWTSTNTSTTTTGNTYTTGGGGTGSAYSPSSPYQPTPVQHPLDFFRTKRRRVALKENLSALPLNALQAFDPQTSMLQNDILDAVKFDGTSLRYWQDIMDSVNFVEIAQDWKGVIELPDGGRIRTDRGHIEVLDDFAKTVYKANSVREFNRFVNASDLLGLFITFCGEIGVTQSEFMDLPIELFIHWLMIEASKADGEEPPEEAIPIESHPKLPKPKSIPRCKACGKFISDEKEEHGITFCNDVHLLLYMQKKQIQ